MQGIVPGQAVDLKMARQPAREFDFTDADILGVNVRHYKQSRAFLPVGT
jgi:hypothetical protein